MKPIRVLQAAVIAGFVALPYAASAQDYDPAGPVTEGVCGLINFQFCPQPPGPAAPLPDPEGDAERAARPVPAPPADSVPPPRHRRDRHHHHRPVHHMAG